MGEEFHHHVLLRMQWGHWANMASHWRGVNTDALPMVPHGLALWDVWSQRKMNDMLGPALARLLRGVRWIQDQLLKFGNNLQRQNPPTPTIKNMQDLRGNQWTYSHNLTGHQWNRERKSRNPCQSDWAKHVPIFWTQPIHCKTIRKKNTDKVKMVIANLYVPPQGILYKSKCSNGDSKIIMMSFMSSGFWVTRVLHWSYRVPFVYGVDIL